MTTRTKTGGRIANPEKVFEGAECCVCSGTRRFKINGACADCTNRRAMAYRVANPDRADAITYKWRLKRFYGMTLEQFTTLRASQDNRCAICLEVFDESEGMKRINVDHSHITGANRGLLCSQCNRGIGCLKDSADVLQRAVNYLQHHEGLANFRKATGLK